MYKSFIESKIGGKPIGLIVRSSEYRDLDCILEMRASIKDAVLTNKYKVPIFADKLTELSNENDIVYFVISDIDKASEKEQERFIELVKFRSFSGYRLPDNVIIIFTVEGDNTIKNIIPELYWLLNLAY